MLEHESFSICWSFSFRQFNFIINVDWNLFLGDFFWLRLRFQDFFHNKLRIFIISFLFFHKLFYAIKFFLSFTINNRIFLALFSENFQKLISLSVEIRDSSIGDLNIEQASRIRFSLNNFFPSFSLACTFSPILLYFFHQSIRFISFRDTRQWSSGIYRIEIMTNKSWDWNPFFSMLWTIVGNFRIFANICQRSPNILLSRWRSFLSFA